MVKLIGFSVLLRVKFGAEKGGEWSAGARLVSVGGIEWGQDGHW